MEKKPLSEAAQFFLRDFQEILDQFSTETKRQVFALDKEGEPITKILGIQEVCELILKNEIGKMRCFDNFKIAFSLVKKEKRSIFLNCYAGFALACLPIMVRGSFIGAIIICGGKYERIENREELIKKYSKLAAELEIIDKKIFLKKAIDEVSSFPEKEMESSAQKLTKLIDILTKNVQTPLKEIFG